MTTIPDDAILKESQKGFSMNQQEVIDDFSSLPIEDQRQIADFIALLKLRHAAPKTRTKRPETDISKEKFVGMWKDRSELTDSSTWVRSMRQHEWRGG